MTPIALSGAGLVALLIVAAVVLVLLLYVTRRERDVVDHHPLGSSRADEDAAPGAQDERGYAAARDRDSPEERFPGGAGTR
jgi:hypothetical protein